MFIPSTDCLKEWLQVHPLSRLLVFSVAVGSLWWSPHETTLVFLYKSHINNNSVETFLGHEHIKIPFSMKGEGWKTCRINMENFIRVPQNTKMLSFLLDKRPTVLKPLMAVRPQMTFPVTFCCLIKNNKYYPTLQFNIKSLAVSNCHLLKLCSAYLIGRQS